MPTEATPAGDTREQPTSRILLLAHRPLTEADFGGGQRTAHIRAAAVELGEVDTLVIMSDRMCRQSPQWDSHRTKTLTYRTGGSLPRSLFDRLRVRRWVRDVLTSGDYDVVIGRYISTALTVPRRYRGRLVLDADDILKTPTASAGTRRRAVSMARSAVRQILLQRLLRQVSHVWFVNPADLATLGHRAKAASLLPNAAITYDSAPRQREPDTLLIVGHYAHAPNREAVDFLLSEVLPGLQAKRPDIALRIVGSVPADCADQWSTVPNVEVLGFVEDLGAEYARTALAVAPVHSGGGTQIKLIEALANGCPTVASHFAYTGFSQVVKADQHLYVAGSAAEWVDTCIRALDDREASERMARDAADVVGRVYGVSAMRDHVRQTLEPLLGKVGARSTPTHLASLSTHESR